MYTLGFFSSYHSVPVFLAFALLGTCLIGVKASQCHTSITGTSLQGHMFMELTNTDIHQCYQRCKTEVQCQSLQFYLSSKKCHLNNRTIAQKPGHSAPNNDAVYFENPIRNLIGSSESLPAVSCPEITTASSNAASGLYWLMDALTGMVAQAYCNMTTGAVETCTGTPCQQGGTCLYKGRGTYTCSCVVGYTGLHCETNVGECASSPCSNGGTCIDGLSSYTCNCVPGYTGLRCQTISSPECSSYTSLTDANRNRNYTTTAALCDRLLTKGWYRFTGAAGTIMASSCVAYSHCQTDATGWLNGTLPSVAQGKVTRQVCFNWYSACCSYNTNIQVRNCGLYYVYELSSTPHCALRYCSQKY